MSGWIVVFNPEDRRYYAAMLTELEYRAGKDNFAVYTIQPQMGNFGTSEEARQAYQARTM